MRAYDHKKIEKKWQAVWEKTKVFQAKDKSSKPKFYSLIEFPYPSGDGLHVGHVRSNTAMDVISRKRRMEGYNVLYPIGWDAFGLPTENYAIKTGIQPAIVTKKNTDTFRKQLKNIGFSFDWSREINTTDPKYYKWTQWIFLQFFKKGLAYKAKILINWCPKDKIGLANEEVINGCCERCGTPVEKREKEQWMLAITKYAERLDKDLDTVDYLPQIKLAQRNWIGKSEGAEIDFKVKDTDEKIKIFTTRADTIFSAFAIILAPEHELVGKLKSHITNWVEVQKYIDEVKKKTDIERTAEDKDKTGIELKGIKAINPVNNEEIPVWIADFVLAQYGTGAVFADMHDERDFAFAKKYKLPMRQSVAQVVRPNEENMRPKEGLPFKDRDAVMCIVKHFEKDEYLCQEWKDFSGVRTLISGGIEEREDSATAGKREIEEESGYVHAKFIKQLGGFSYVEFYHQRKKVNTRARFRYLYYELEDGEKVSIAKEEDAQHMMLWKKRDEVLDFLNISEKERIWDLFNGKDDIFTGEGVLVDSGIYTGMSSAEARPKIIKAVGGRVVTKFKLRDWVFSRQRYWGEPIPVINCEKCGLVPVPEKDLPVVLPKVKNYQPTDTGESPLANISKWVNVKCPNCEGPANRETDTMPNWAGSSWYYLRYTDPKNNKAFAGAKNLKYWTPVDWYNGGNEHTTLHLLYSRFWHKFLYDLKLVPTAEPYKKRTSHGLILAEGGVKMSKSKGNVINPDTIVNIYGADTLRLYEMFMGPFEQSIAWSEDAIIGPRRFLERVWKIGQKILEQKNFEGGRFHPKGEVMPKNSSVPKILNKTIKKVTEDIDAMRFNTAVSTMMILANEMEKENVSVEDYKKFLQILSPFAPHIAEELWSMLGKKGTTQKSINLSSWPTYDTSLMQDEEIKIVIQVNGKVRAEIMIHTDHSEEEIKAQALSNENVLKYTLGVNIKKVIYVKNRLINIVI